MCIGLEYQSQIRPSKSKWHISK